MLLLLLLSRSSRVRLCATPETAAHQAPPSLGSSRQEHWSGLPFPSPMHESESEVGQSCPTPSDPMDCSLLGSSIHGIFQARVLEWGATSFSKMQANIIQMCFEHQFWLHHFLLAVSVTLYRRQQTKPPQRKTRRQRGYLRKEVWFRREGNGTPLQYSCLENPMDGGAW